MQSHISKCWSRDMRIANWYKNCKLIWKLQTHIKIAHVHVGTIPKCENCKMIWKLQIDMKIAIWYENCKAILTFWCIVLMWTFAIFIWDTAGMKTCSGTERMIQFDCGVDDKNTTKQSLAKPSTIHILIPIPMLRHSDSYFKTWFLCSPWLILFYCQYGSYCTFDLNLQPPNLRQIHWDFWWSQPTFLWLQGLVY